MYVTGQHDQWVKVLASKVTILALRGGEEGGGEEGGRGGGERRGGEEGFTI